jgi:predicted negative regulator of RcsB-dependent stress response
VIKQKALSEYLVFKGKIARADQRLKEKKAEFKDMEDALIAQIVEDDEIEEGKLEVILTAIVKRANISWKSIVVSLKGRAFVEKTLADAPRDYQDKLIVREKIR